MGDRALGGALHFDEEGIFRWASCTKGMHISGAV